MTLWMVAAEDEIDELLEHALGSLAGVVGQSPAKVKQALYRSVSNPTRDNGDDSVEDHAHNITN